MPSGPDNNKWEAANYLFEPLKLASIVAASKAPRLDLLDPDAFVLQIHHRVLSYPPTLVHRNLRQHGLYQLLSARYPLAGPPGSFVLPFVTLDTQD